MATTHTTRTTTNEHSKLAFYSSARKELANRPEPSAHQAADIRCISASSLCHSYSPIVRFRSPFSATFRNRVVERRELAPCHLTAAPANRITTTMAQGQTHINYAYARTAPDTGHLTIRNRNTGTQTGSHIRKWAFLHKLHFVCCRSFLFLLISSAFLFIFCFLLQ